MIKITNTNDNRDKIDGKSDKEWRKAKSQIIPKLNSSSCVPDSEIDAIAATMDQPNSEAQDYEIPQHSINPSKNDVASLMVQQYIRKNGGIPLPDSKIKRNQVIID